MVREYYHRQVEDVLQDVLRLASEVEMAVGQATVVLQTRDGALASTLVANDDVVDQAQRAINAQTLILIARQAPVAVDLRLLTGILVVAGELERISDYVEDIAKTIVWGAVSPVVPGELVRMADLSCQMLHQAVQAFEHRDADRARRLAAQDDEVDLLMMQQRKALLQKIMERPGDSEMLIDLWFVALQYERIGDRATNIAEQAVFVATGEVVNLNESRVPGQRTLTASDIVRTAALEFQPPV